MINVLPELANRLARGRSQVAGQPRRAGRLSRVIGAAALMAGVSIAASCSDGDEQPASDQTTTTTNVTTSEPQAEGSGCEVDGGTLPDGRWYGFITDTADEQLSFDLACWFVGEEAAAAAHEDGEEPPPNDFYVRNQQPLVRPVRLGSSLSVLWLPNPGAPDEETIPYEQWLSDSPARGFEPGVWLEIDSGVVTSIREQYTP